MTENRTRISSKKAVNIVAIAFSLTVLLSPAASTSVTQTDVPVSGTQTFVSPGTDNVDVFRFTVNDGGDEPIYNEPDPGTPLHSFQDNYTVFLNHSNPPNADVAKGVNGYDAGDDIIRMSRYHTGGTNNSVSGNVMGNFSDYTYFLDGGVSKDGSFQGDGGTGTNSELIIRDKGAPRNELDDDDEVISAGYADLRSFGSDVYFTNASIGDLGSHAFSESEAIVRNDGTNASLLETGDTILREGYAGIDSFDDSVVSFTDADGDGNYAQDAIIANGGSNDDLIEEQDTVLTPGSANMNVAQNSNLSYYESDDSPTTGFDDIGEPI